MYGPRALFTTASAACALALVLLVPAPAVASAAASVGATTEPRAAAALEDPFAPADCPMDVPVELRGRLTCGVLTVPERRSSDADPAKTLSLIVVVVASRSPIAPDPLVVPTTTGAFRSVGSVLEHADWADAERDVILVEQRGDALAGVSLDCPELGTRHFVADGVLLSGEAARERRTAQLDACRVRLTEAGVDLAAYTSAAGAADLADLRTALGYDSWDLYGAAYGSRLALTVMRDRPDGLRAVILDGVYPPNINRYEATPAGFTGAIDALIADCAADADCHEHYPSLRRTLLSVLDSAARTPLSVMVNDPTDRSPIRWDVTDTDLVGILFDALSDADLVRALPFVIDRLSHGDVETLTPLAQRSLDDAEHSIEGLALSIDCAEEAPFNDDARIESALAAEPILAHYGLSDGFREDCTAWAVPPLAESENAPVTSAIPTLLMTGAHDPATPASFSEAAAASLSVNHPFRFPTLSRAPIWTDASGDCAATVARQFLIDPATAPDASCIDAMPPVEFLTGADIEPRPGISRIDADLLQDRDPLQIVIAALTLLVFAGTLVYAAIYGITWLGRRRGDAPGGLVLVAATSSGLNLAYAGVLGFVLLSADPLILAFGLPSGAWPIVILPFTALGAAILLIVSLVQAWMQEEGTLFHRVVLTVSASASACFAVWLLVRGLLAL